MAPRKPLSLKIVRQIDWMQLLADFPHQGLTLNVVRPANHTNGSLPVVVVSTDDAYENNILIKVQWIYGG